MNETGGTRATLIGNLKRRLASFPLARIQNGEGVTVGNVTQSCIIRGLSSVLRVFVGVGAYTRDNVGNQLPFPASSWPANAGTMQITPQSFFQDRGKVPFRPVFQDPTAVDHLNHPLPQALPFSWNFRGECDEAIVDVVFNQAAWAGTAALLFPVLQVMVEWDGSWWDIDAMNLAFSQVQVNGPSIELVINSA